MTARDDPSRRSYDKPMRSMSRSLVLSLVPVFMVVGMWMISLVYGSFRIGHFKIFGMLVEITSTSWRALEVALVSNPAYVRGGEYCVLPKAHPPFLGMYVGPVRLGPGPATLLLFPYYVLTMASLALPAYVLWRSSRQRIRTQGFEVAQA